MNSDTFCRNPYYNSNSLYGDICYKEGFCSESNKPPFELYINPKKFYTSQIPGLKPEETQLIDKLADNPKVLCIMIEIITYQRMYSSELSFLLTELGNVINQNQKYGILAKSFMPKLTSICSGHEKISKEIDQTILNQPADSIALNFASYFIKKIDFLTELQLFSDEVKKNDNILIEISLDNSEKISPKIGGKTVIQMLKSSKSWLNFIIDSIQKLMNLFSADNTDYRHLNEISKALQVFLNKL